MLFRSSLNQWPLVCLFVGLMLLSLSLPIFVGWLVYGLLGYSFCVTYFVVLLDLPKAGSITVYLLPNEVNDSQITILGRESIKKTVRKP